MITVVYNPPGPCEEISRGSAVYKGGLYVTGRIYGTSPSHRRA